MDNLPGTVLLWGAIFFVVLERCSRLRRGLAPVQRRWLTNIGLLLLGGGLAAIVLPLSLAQVAGGLQTGLIRDMQLPLAAEFVLLLLIVDLWRYWEHRVLHEVPVLWRVHLVHHSDTAVDVTTTRRHHPFEVLLSALLSLMLVFALGFSAVALGLYLALTTLASLFHHANINLPERLDRPLRALLVTPGVHRVHHSSFQPETDSNYGSVFSVWDRLFGTYTAPGSEPVQLGLVCFRRARDETLLAALLQPFRFRPGAAAARTTTPPDSSLPTSASSRAHWQLPLRIGIAGVALSVLAFWPTVVDLVRLWTHHQSYQYAHLVPPLFCYLLGWHYRDRLLTMTPVAGYTGLPVILSAIALGLASSSAHFMLGAHLAFVLALQGVALCALGRAVYRELLPAMLLLFLMVPSGDIVQPLLLGLTTRWLESFAIVTGLPYTVHGYSLSIDGLLYDVLDACSGLALFTLGGFLGYCFGLLAAGTLRAVLAFAALGALLGTLANGLRVCLIVGIDVWSGTKMAPSAHELVQWLLVALMIIALLFAISRFNSGGEESCARAQ